MTNFDKKENTVKTRGIHLIHFFVTILAFLAVFEQFYIMWYLGGFFPKRTLLLLAIYAVVYLFLLRAYNAYDVGVDTISGLFFSQSLSVFITDIIIYGAICLMWTDLMNPLPIAGLFVFQLFVNLVWSYFANKWYFKKNSNQRTLVLYDDKDKLEVLKSISYFDRKYDVKKYLSIKDFDTSKVDFVRNYSVVFIIDLPEDIRNEILKVCIEYGVKCLTMPHIGDILMMGGKHVQNCYSPIYMVDRSHVSMEYAVIKRLFDVVVCSLTVVILSPVFLITAIAIKMEDHGPVFYKQERLTKGGKRFNIIKFRSMRVDAEKDGVAKLAEEGDPRITKVGAFIRKCRIDEIPQFLNIIKGDMTIVGPRPERPEIAKIYEGELEAFNTRLQVKAGLTGYAQIYGKYNTNPYQKLLMDLIYINNMSVLTDLKIMFATIRVLFEEESTEGVGGEEQN